MFGKILPFFFLFSCASFALDGDDSMLVQKLQIPHDSSSIYNVSGRLASDPEIEKVIAVISENTQQPAKNPVVVFGWGTEPSRVERELSKHGVSYVKLNLSNLIDGRLPSSDDNETAELSRFRAWWKSKYIKPTKEEVRWGVTASAGRGIASSAVWFSVGLDPLTASALAIGQTAVEVMNTVYGRTVENILGINTGEQQSAHGPLRNRLLYAAFWAYLWRGISGPVQQAHSILTLPGNIEVLSNVLSKGLAGSFLGMEKVNRLSRRASSFIGFQTYLLGSVLTTMDLAGLHFKTWILSMPVWSGGYSFELKASTLFIIGFYTSLGLAIRYFPEAFESYTQFIDHQIEKMKKSFRPSCGRVFQ